MKQRNPYCSIIIPTYNEAGNIVPLIGKIKAVLLGIDYEIVIIDDRSEDGTYSLVRKTYKNESNIRCFLHQGRRSMGKSIFEGIMKSCGDVVIGMDADFNHDPCLLPKLIASLDSDKYDIAVASRFIKDGGMENKFKYRLSLLFNLCLRHFFGFPIHDNTSGYYAIKRETLLGLGPQRIYHGYGEYQMRLLYSSHKEGLSIGEIPAWYVNRGHGRSKSNYCKMFITYLYTACCLKWNYKKIKKPPAD